MPERPTIDTISPVFPDFSWKMKLNVLLFKLREMMCLLPFLIYQAHHSVLEGNWITVTECILWKAVLAIT